MRLIAGLTRRLGRLPAVEIATGAVWAIGLAVIEVVGRRSNTDMADAALLLGLGCLVLATALVHAARELWIVVPLLRTWQALKKWSRIFKVKFGVDLRGTPPLPRGFPLVLRAALVVPAGITSMMLVYAHWFPGEARAFAAPRCYLAYLAAIGTIWLSGLVFTCGHALLAWAAIHDLFVGSFTGQGRRPLRPEALAVCAVIGVTVAAAALLPPWAPLAFYCVQFGLAGGACALSSRGLWIAWRRPGTAVHVFDGRWLILLQAAILALLTAVLVLCCRGDTLRGATGTSPGVSLPVTVTLGAALAWSGVAGMGVVTWHCVRFAWLGIRFNPQRSPRSVGDSGDPQQTERLRRTAEIQSRRSIIRGLEKLFKRAARQSRRPGTGLWIGLQHWFLLGMSYDDEGDTAAERETTAIDEIVGPPYHRVFRPEARYHFGQVTRALEIDLIFVEHSIPFRRLVRVLRQMFETYDVFGGRQRAEEWHFCGLPGIRVVIHDFDFNAAAATRPEGYPEPDYTHVGRARILHVFKDRGDQQATDFVPDECEWLPAPAGQL